MSSSSIPVLPLRDIVVFPGMVAPLFVGRKQSVNALNHSMSLDKKIFLLAQKNSETDNPNKSDLYECGTVAKVLQLLKLPDGTIKVLVEGTSRAKLMTLNTSGDFLSAKIKTVDTKFKNNNNLKSDSRREPVSAQKNTWTDEGEHKNISTPDVQRTPRNRPPPKMKDVTCNKCNKIFKVNASVVYGEYHICDRCVSKR